MSRDAASPHDEAIVVDTERAAQWYFQDAAEAISNIHDERIRKILRAKYGGQTYRKDIVIDNAVLCYLGERMDWSPESDGSRRKFRIASKSLFENWKGGRRTRAVTRLRRDLTAFYVAFGVDITQGNKIESSALGLAGKIARLYRVKAERTRAGIDNTEIFLVRAEAIDFEPETKNVEDVRQGKPPVLVGTCTIGITGCRLRISSMPPEAPITPMIELIEEGQRTQFGVCSGLYVKWDFATEDWSIGRGQCQTSVCLLGSLARAQLAEVEARKGERIRVSIEVDQSQVYPVFRSNREDFGSSAPEADKAKRKLLSQVIRQRMKDNYILSQCWLDLK